jgi:signal transduction histidine kinase
LASTASTFPVALAGWLDRVRANPFLAVVVGAVCTAGTVLAAFAVATASISGTAVFGVLALLTAAALAEALPVPVVGVRAGATSLANIFIVAATALYSWQTGVVVALATILIAEVFAPRPFLRAAYNVGLYCCSAGAAGAVMVLLSDVNDLDIGVAAVPASLAFFVTDVCLLGTVIAASNRLPLTRVLRDLVRSTAAACITMATTTAVLVFVWEQAPLASAFLVPPLVTIVLYQRRLHASLERQRELDRMKDEFVAVVSHELRTPLASVYGGVETLQRNDLNTEQRAAVLDVVREEGARLARLVDDVLWVSRLRTPAQRPATGRCDPADVIDHVVDSAATVAPPGLSLTAAHGVLPDAAVDEDALRRVLGNLVENAVKYSPDGGRVAVSGTADDGMLRLDVADEGIGVPADQYETIFEKFSRLDPQMGRGIGGTGLGLYICRELVEQMGGSISVSPNPGGRGSVFSVRVPTVVPEGD